MKSRIGTALMIIGLLMMAAALALSAYNLMQEHSAGREAEQTLAALEKLLLEPEADSVDEQQVVVNVRSAHTPVPQHMIPSVVSELDMLKQKAASEGEPSTATPIPADVTPVPTQEPNTTLIPADVSPVPTQEPNTTPIPAEVTPVPTQEPNITPIPAEVTPVPTQEPNTTPIPADVLPVPTQEPNTTPIPAEVTPVPTQEPNTTPIPAEVTTLPTQEPNTTPIPAEVTPVPTQEPIATIATPIPAETTPIPTPTPAPTPTATPVLPDYLRFPEMEMPEKEINGYSFIGKIEIPVLELELPIMADWTYDQLKISPCRFEGSAYTDHFVLMAHNYETHFGKLNQLRPEDLVIFTDVRGNQFPYKVALTETIGGNDLKGMVETEYPLTLFTCTIGGVSRVTVRCERLEPLW